jgi:APA family basic amino acid/polyamine antiporter
VQAARWSWLVPVVRAGAAVAALGSLLALVPGVSRTVFAMARDRHLPGALAAVHPRFGVPHRAEFAVDAVVAGVVLLADVRGAIGFSSVCVLVSYAVANASALTLERARGRWLVPVVGLIGCLAVAVSLPLATTAAGFAVLAVGALLWGIRRAVGRGDL